MEKTWLVMCPDWRERSHDNKAHGWALSKATVKNVGTDYFGPRIQCIICGKMFSLCQGLGEAFSEDIVIDLFQHDSFEHGDIVVHVGYMMNVSFASQFADVPEVSLTRTTQNPIDAIAGHITERGFAIVSSAMGPLSGSTGSFSWYASGNRAKKPALLWRLLLSNSKSHQRSKNYRSEIIDLESAFEVFVSDYLAKNLAGKLRPATIEWLLRKNSVEDQLNIGFTELWGNPLRKIHEKEYCEWQKKVKEKRDGIIHRGASVTADEAFEARKSVLDLIISVDNSAVNEFQVGMRERSTDGPYMSFGTASIGNPPARISWKAYA